MNLIVSPFSQVDALDTIVSAGEVLYIPSFWFHYVISLDYSIQVMAYKQALFHWYQQY
jgi:hypothetical protein